MKPGHPLTLELKDFTRLAASRDAELMLNSGLSFAGWHVAEKLDIPAAIQQAASDEAIQRKAAQLGRQIRAEDGVETAVRQIEAFAREGHF